MSDYIEISKAELHQAVQNVVDGGFAKELINKEPSVIILFPGLVEKVWKELKGERYGR